MDRIAVAKELTAIAKSLQAGFTADEVFDAMMMDIWPGSAAVVDFGLDDQRHYEALYYPILSGEITKLQLRKVAGKGPAITALVNRSRSNPHKGIKFVTSYDNM